MRGERMSKIKTILLLTVFFPIMGTICADPALVTFLQPPPVRLIKQLQREDAIIDKLEKFYNGSLTYSNRKLLKAFLREQLSRVDGFLALYSGYSTYSDRDGMITFPIRHSPAGRIYLMVTPKIKMDRILKHTFSSERVAMQNDTSVYTYERRKDEDDNNYWQVRKISLRSLKAHPASIKIITKAKNIFVEEGDFFTEDNGNLLLPDNIYVVGRNDNVKSLLNFLNISRYFDPMKFEKQNPQGTIEQRLSSKLPPTLSVAL